MKYFIVVGERSGDLHAAKLAGQIKRLDVRAEIEGYGGDLMAREGVNILRHYSVFSFMGIVEVLMNLGSLKKTLKDCKQAIKNANPHVLILVDFPGINLKLATFAKKHGIKTCYYISPKIWASREYRIRRMKRDIDKMMIILPFEIAYFKKKNFEVDYVGNPLVDAIGDYDFDETFKIDDRKVNIAILPGSRKQEISASAHVVKEMAESAPDYRFWIAGVDNVDATLYEPYKKMHNVSLIFDKTYDILKHANAAVVTSGTATLEAALLNCPQVVVYRANPVTVLVLKLLVHIEWISLVNLIANKTVVKELIQREYTAKNVLNEVDFILNDHRYCATMMDEYQKIREKIGTEATAKKAAGMITEWLTSSSGS